MFLMPAMSGTDHEYSGNVPSQYSRWDFPITEPYCAKKFPHHLALRMVNGVTTMIMDDFGEGCLTY